MNAKKTKQLVCWYGVASPEDKTWQKIPLSQIPIQNKSRHSVQFWEGEQYKEGSEDNLNLEVVDSCVVKREPFVFQSINWSNKWWCKRCSKLSKEVQLEQLTKLTKLTADFQYMPTVFKYHDTYCFHSSIQMSVLGFSASTFWLSCASGANIISN